MNGLAQYYREIDANRIKTLISLKKYNDIDYGFKLSLNNIGYKDNIYTFPYFCTFLLKRFMKTFNPNKD